MHVATLRLVNFRSYCDAQVAFGPGLNVVVGRNAAGKTNLLEGAWFALRGGSPRTRRDEKLITWGEPFTRVELALDEAEGARRLVEIGYAPGRGKRLQWAGVEVPSLDDLRGRSQVFIFVPESLLLVKGSPARRRAHLDAFASALDPGYAGAARELQETLRQRNAQLLAVKRGAPPSALDPWDAQFARAATDLGRRRRDLVTEMAPLFAAAAAGLAPDGSSFAVRLAAQLESLGYDDDAVLDELRRRRGAETARGLSLFGPHRDDLRFVEVSAEEERAPAPAAAARPALACGPVDLPAGGRDLRLFGSQGEQRAAVLALLLAEQQLAAERTGERGTLFLDDVMSELDDARRRLLVRTLASAGQAIITTTDLHYFTEEELVGATVIELPLSGSLAAGEAPTASSGGGAPAAVEDAP